MLTNLFKTLVRALQTLNTCIKPLRMPTPFKDFHENPCGAASKSKIMLKTLAYCSASGKAETHAGAGGLLDSPASSVEATLPSRTRTASHARTHARHEHETKPKPISRLGSTASILPPQSPTDTHDSSLQMIWHISCQFATLRSESVMVATDSLSSIAAAHQWGASCPSPERPQAREGNHNTARQKLLNSSVHPSWHTKLKQSKQQKHVLIA